MFKAEQRLCLETVKNKFQYDPKTGDIINKITGKCVGYVHYSRSKQYYRTKIGGHAILLHRLAYFLKEGHFPEKRVDHIDGNGLNNKWDNLRLVEHYENMRNSKINCANTSKILGVNWRSRRGRIVCTSRIGDGSGKRITLYEGHDFFEACCRRKSAELQMNYHKNHGRIEK